MKLLDVAHMRKCAFCKNWYDPTNSAISPRNTKLNLWYYDEKCSKVCKLRNYDMSADSRCGDYECKLELYQK